MSKREHRRHKPARRTRTSTHRARPSVGSPVTGSDADLQNYLRAPYDPVYSARMEGRVIGLLLRGLWRRLRRW